MKTALARIARQFADGLALIVAGAGGIRGMAIELGVAGESGPCSAHGDPPRKAEGALALTAWAHVVREPDSTI